MLFEGASNFRDLGGYHNASGGRTRWSTLYRADSLHELTPEDVQRYSELGIRVVYDLRRDSEREVRPNLVPSIDMCITTPIDLAGVEPLDRTAMSDRRSGEQLLRTMYANMLAHSGAVIGELFTGFADPARVPAVFHCHAGKDRTGIVAALLLEALGVSRADVLDDYELTAHYRRREDQLKSYETLIASGMAAEAAGAVLGAPRWAMADTMDDLDSVYGGVEAYLLGPAGLDPATLARLRGLLVET